MKQPLKRLNLTWKMNKYLSYDNLNDFWKFAMQDSRAYEKSSRRAVDRWSGGTSWEESKLLALNGWKDGLKEIEKYRAQLAPFITDKILRPIQLYSVSGYNVDVGAFLSNDPECFISRVYEERNYPGKIFKIVCSISFSASITPETIIQRGAMICALVDALEYAGHRAEVYCNFAAAKEQYYRDGTNKKYGWFEVDVKIKPSDQPVELSSLAFCLAHPSMLRRIVFSIAEIVGWSDYASNYGYPSKATDKGDIYIDEIFSGTVPDSNAIDWVLNKLKELGIDLEIK
jgi:hypothetical protein